MEETGRNAETVDPAARFVRGWLCAVLATFLAAASHGIAGGSTPYLAVLVSLALSGMVCVGLAGKQLSLPRILAGVALSQGVFHVLFEFLSTAPAASTIPVFGGTAHGEHSHDALLLPMVGRSADTLAGMGTSSGMLVSHVVAGLLTAALVRHGEQLWWALLAAVGAVLTTITGLIRLLPVDDDARRDPARRAAFGLYELLHSDTRRRLRGPPMGASSS